MQQLPLEITDIILEYTVQVGCMLPVCRLVCKEWNSLLCSVKNIVFLDVCAAMHGYLPVLQWLYDNVCVDKYNSIVMDTALAYGHTHIADWLYASGSRPSDRPYELPAEHGKLTSCVWLYEHGYEIDANAVASAVYSDNLELVQWMLGICPDLMDCDIFTHAVSIRRMKIANWLYTQNCPSDQSTFSEVLLSGDFELTKALYEQHKYTPDQIWPGYAVWSKSTKILDWAFEQGCEFTEDEFGDAIQTGEISVVQWLQEKNLMDLRSGYLAANDPDPCMIEYLVNLGYEPDTQAYISAAYFENIVVLDWLHARGYPGAHVLKNNDAPIIKKWYESKMIQH